MPASALPAVLSAVYAALDVPSLTVDLGCTVYDNLAPQGAAYPYAVVSSPTETTEDSMGYFGSEVTVQVHIWTKQIASGQATRILSEVRALLDYGKGRAGDPELAVAGYSTVMVWYETGFDNGVEVINSVEYQHFIAQFRIFVREAAAA